MAGVITKQSTRSTPSIVTMYKRVSFEGYLSKPYLQIGSARFFRLIFDSVSLLLFILGSIRHISYMAQSRYEFMPYGSPRNDRVSGQIFYLSTRSQNRTYAA